jgi:hypothetical protein
MRNIVVVRWSAGPLVRDEMDLQGRWWRGELALPGQFERVRHEEL